LEVKYGRFSFKGFTQIQCHNRQLALAVGHADLMSSKYSIVILKKLLLLQDQVAVRDYAIGGLVAPLSGGNRGLQKAHVTNGIREVQYNENPMSLALERDMLPNNHVGGNSRVFRTLDSVDYQIKIRTVTVLEYNTCGHSSKFKIQRKHVNSRHRDNPL